MSKKIKLSVSKVLAELSASNSDSEEYVSSEDEYKPSESGTDSESNSDNAGKHGIHRIPLGLALCMRRNPLMLSYSMLSVV